MITLLISLILDGIISNIVSLNSVFLPLCTIISFIIIYPFYKKDLINYLINIIIIGIIYDLLYGNIYFINVISFSLVGIFIHYISSKFNYNYITLIIKIIFVICFYRIITYLISILFNNNISLILLITSIYRSIILNTLYGLLLYYIYNHKVSKKI